MKFLHISDLHVIGDTTEALLREANHGLHDLDLKIRVDAGSAHGRELLLQTIFRRHKNAFDAILVTGDLTGCGDDQSLEIASAFLKDLARVGLREPNLKRVYVIPGNHDVLEWTLRAFLQHVTKMRTKWWFIRLWPGTIGQAARVAEALDGILAQLRPDGPPPPAAGTIADFSAYLESGFNIRFSDFTVADASEAKIYDLKGQSSDGRDVSVALSLVSTVTLTPFLFAQGMVPEPDALKLNLTLAMRDRAATTIALTHQGFFPLPTGFVSGLAKPQKRDYSLVFEHSFASLINGYNLARIFQSNDVELHFHGHEHVHRAATFDFEMAKPGVLSSFGTAASGQIEGTDCGYTVIEFKTPHVVGVQPFEFDSGTAEFEPKDVYHVRVGDVLPGGRLTRLGRGELHKIFYQCDDPAKIGDAAMSRQDFNKECRRLFRSSHRKLLYFGVRLKSARRMILEVLDGGSPEEVARCTERLFEGVNFLVTTSTSMYPAVRQPADDVAEGWKAFINEVAERLGKSAAVMRKHLVVRETDAPLAHSGLVEYSDTPRGPLFHRGLIQTNRFEQTADNELFFEVRENVTSAFLKYYAGTALQLWMRGNEMAVPK